MGKMHFLILRVYSYTIGYIPLCAHFLKKLLIFFLITGRKNKYVAATKYFDAYSFLSADGKPASEHVSKKGGI
jgi:hypothetical protein